MYVPTAVSDVLWEWNLLCEERGKESRQQELSNGETPQEWGTDRDRANLLADMRSGYCAQLTGWHVQHVTMYLKAAFPHSVFKKTRNNGVPSLLLRELHEAWEPQSLEEWIELLWQYTDRAHQYFADILSLNHFVDGTPEFWKAQDLSPLGDTLFINGSDLFGFDEDVKECLIGKLVENPRDSSMVGGHAVDIMRLMHPFPAEQIGRACRRLLLYRTRPPQCTCMYACECRRRLLEMDSSREYALALIKALFQELDRTKLQGLQEGEVNHFKHVIVEAASCEVYTVPTYKELCRSLELPLPDLLLRNPRIPSPEETVNGFYEGTDGQLAKMDGPGGCLSIGCRHIPKEDCTNGMCREHCISRGANACWPHRFDGNRPQFS